MHMCLIHWRMVPKAFQAVIWAYYRNGQEIDKNPSIEYLCAMFGSIACVAIREGKTPPSFKKVTGIPDERDNPF